MIETRNSNAISGGVSEPIAMVIAGLFVGNVRKERMMKTEERELLNLFWSFIDEIFNAVLFCLLGLQVLVIQWRFEPVWVGPVAIPAGLAGRWISVGGAVALLNIGRKFDARSAKNNLPGFKKCVINTPRVK